eukprot:CAMPEP_0184018024 /NCGR_PEP_ID=MMETSP0954-20121128/7894_1 /TAXON_ID=627963 /ORGANISM="Aplanochytrium sp, Strain PBS07" /LENGTH=797 /DNA_ID=CAMNT_0026299389 /DNA_START=128 /DNA_END=2521 /DNA_ORIENTATION=-
MDRWNLEQGHSSYSDDSSNSSTSLEDPVGAETWPDAATQAQSQGSSRARLVRVGSNRARTVSDGVFLASRRRTEDTFRGFAFDDSYRISMEFPQEQEGSKKIITETDLKEAFSEKDDHPRRLPRFSSLRKRTRGVKCSGNYVVSKFPVCDWLPKYNWRKFGARDVVVGITLAFVIAPKAMAHALLAELPPIYGVYTAFFSTLIYGIMGTSKWLSVGTAALPALLFGEALLGTGLSEDEFTRVGPMLTLYVALATAAMGLLRLDRLLRFISPVALSAFTTTAAFLIGTTQMKFMFGLNIKVSGFVQTYVEIFKNIKDTNLATFGLGIASIAFLFTSKILTRKYGSKYKVPDPGALLLVLVSVGLVKLLDLDSKYGVDVVGTTPSGFPSFRSPWESFSSSSVHTKLIVDALLIAAINYILAMAIAKSFAEKCNKVLNTSQELLALSCANLAGSFFGSFVAGGSFSGSALISAFNASSLIHNFVNSMVMMCILLWLTPVIELLPKVTLAAIILVALPKLVDFKRPAYLFKVKGDDFVVWVLTFIVTLLTGVQWGIICGTIFSLFTLLYRVANARVTEVGCLPGTSIYRALSRFPDAKRLDKVRMLRLDSSINFANAHDFESKLTAALLSCREKPKSSKKKRKVFDKLKAKFAKLRKQKVKSDSSVQDSSSQSNDLSSLPLQNGLEDDANASQFCFIISCEAVNDVDSAALAVLMKFSKLCSDHGYKLLFSGFKANVRETLLNARCQYEASNNDKSDDKELPAVIDGTKWFLNLHDAATRAQREKSHRVLATDAGNVLVMV